MSSTFESQSERPLGPHRDKSEVDSHKRAECAERINRLLSALEGGCSIDKDKTTILPKSAESKTNPDSDVSPRFLLMDRTGPIAEFGSWDEANKYKQDRQHYSASILSFANNSLGPGENQELPPTKQAVTCDTPNSPSRSVIQESKKAVDAGESHSAVPRSSSLKPVNSKVMRVAGRIFPAAAKTVTLNACPSMLAHRYEMLVLGTSGAQITSAAGFGHLTLTHTPRTANYEPINILYTTEPTNGSQRP